MSKSKNGNTSTAVVPTDVSPPQMLQQAAAAGNTELVRELMTLEREWRTGRAEEQFYAALSAVSPHLPAITKSRVVDFTSQKGRTSYKYADLGVIIEAIKPLLAEHGLSLTFETGNDLTVGTVTVTAILTWAAVGGSRFSKRNTLTCPVDTTGNKNAIQAIGSAQTYLQRYTAMAILGLAATEDDDGQSSGNGVTDDPPITPDQVVQLAKLIVAAQTTEEKFLKWAKAKSLADIRAPYFESCKTQLEDIAKKKSTGNAQSR